MKSKISKADHAVAALKSEKASRIENLHKLGGSLSEKKNGGQTWMLVFVSPDGIRDEIDLRFLNDMPGLGEPLYIAFGLWGRRVVQRTRVINARNLRVGLAAFLKVGARQDMKLSDLDGDFFFGFIRWLNQPRLEMKLQPWAHGTRDALFTPLRTLIFELSNDKSYGPIARIISELIPNNPWDGISTKSTPVERMQMDDLRRVVSVCETEIKAIDKRMSAFALDTLGGSDQGDFEKCLRLFSNRFDGVLPTRREISEAHPDLFPLIRTSGWLSKMPEYLYAQPRDLVPFVLLIAISTVFNPDTVLSIDKGSVESNEHLGNKFVKITGVKARATTDQVAVISDSSVSDLGISHVLSILEKLTKRLRSSVSSDEHKNLLFLYSPATRSGKKARGFLNRNRSCGVGIWQHALKKFISDNRLTDFNLRRIRPTLLDELWLRTGDVTAVKQFSQHRHVETLWKHYTSDGTRKRFKERIGETLLLQERWWKTGGTVDPRTSARPPHMDKGAAPPGFVCFDPYDSPRPGQLRNVLCSAYGECASCPNAAASASDPAAVALYIAMDLAILDSRVRIDPLAWAEKWASVIEDLEALIGSLPEQVVRDAANFRTTLSGVA